MKVAVLGASGIGKYHAQWFHKEGCEVVAFLTKNEETISSTRNLLKQLFSFNGRGYFKFEKLLEEEQPDIVVVATPTETHYEYTVAALEFGSHVYREKPFIWESQFTKNILSRAQQLLQTAKRKKLLLGINTQYVAAIPFYKSFQKLDSGINSFYFEMETNKNINLTYENLWIEMMPHPLSMLIKWLNNGTIDKESIDCIIKKKEFSTRFNYSTPNNVCKVQIIGKCVNTHPIRRFGINNIIVDCVGKRENSYNNYLIYNGQGLKCDDFMYQSIKKFIYAVKNKQQNKMLVPPKDIYKNLELQVDLYNRIKQII